MVAGHNHDAAVFTTEKLPQALDPPNRILKFLLLPAEGNVARDDDSVEARKARTHPPQIKFELVPHLLVFVVQITDYPLPKMNIGKMDKNEIRVVVTMRHRG